MNPSSRHRKSAAGSIFLAAALLWCGISGVHGAVPGDFAVARTLHGGEGSLRSLTLSAEIYRRLRGDDLGDIRIFNASGREAPMLIRGGGSTPTEEASQRPLTFYPLPREVDAEQPLGGLSLRLERTAEGEVLQLDTQPTAPQPESGPPLAYLIDLGDTQQAPQALQFQWANDSGNLMARFRLSQSDDLIRWRPSSSEGILSSLRYGGDLLKRDRVELQSRGRFLRLEWLNPAQRPTLTGIRGEFRDTRRAEADWLELGRPTPDEANNDYRLDTGGPFPVTRLELKAPSSGMFYQGQLWSSASAQGPWKKRREFRQYWLEIDGENWRSDAIGIGRMRDRYWRITFSTPKNPLEAELPSIRIGYEPDQLLFLAQGEGPFKIAYGSSIVSHSSSPLTTLIKDLEADGKSPSEVSLGEEQKIGGGDKPPPPWPWEKFLLWTVLIAGVLLLGWMARRLLRELNP